MNANASSVPQNTLQHPMAARKATGEVSFVIVDDHPVVAFALRALIESQKNWRVVAQVDSPGTAIELIDRHRPDIVIMDLLFPSQCGLESVRSLERTHPHVRTVVYSVQPARVYGPMCMAAGAEGYLRKDSSVTDVVRGLRAVVAGTRWVGDGPWEPSQHRAGAGGDSALSAREIEVLQLLAQGMTSREIALVLCRSIKTIETHRHRLGRKLGARNAADLMRLAIRHCDGPTPGAVPALAAPVQPQAQFQRPTLLEGGI